MRGNVTVNSHVGGLAWGVGFLALAALLIPHPAWMIMLVCLGGAWGIAYGWMQVLMSGISAERHLQSNWVAIDDVLVEQFIIRNRSWLPAPYIEISDWSNVPGYRPAFVVSINQRTRRTWRQAAVCTRRGRYRLGPWALRLGDPFGFYTVSINYEQATEIVIHPPILPNLPITLPIGQQDGSRSPQRLFRQADLNAAEVRHYQPSDPRRHIHWPTTARRNALFVREFEPDAGGDVWILLDMATANQIGKGRLCFEEQAVLLAATVAERLLHQHQAVGLAAYGKQPHLLSPGHGTQQRWRLLEALATISADGEAPLAVVLNDLRRMIKNGSALMIVSAMDSLSAELLIDLRTHKQAGVAISVVLFDRQSYGVSGNAAAIQQQLTLVNIACAIIDAKALQSSRERPKTVWQLMEAS